MPVAPEITDKLLRRRQKLVEKQRSADRESRALKREKDAIDHDICQALKTARKTSLLRAGFRLRVSKRHGRVSWKDELIARIGARAVAALQDKAPTREVLEIEREKAAA